MPDELELAMNAAVLADGYLSSAWQSTDPAVVSGLMHAASLRALWSAKQFQEQFIAMMFHSFPVDILGLD
jgi:hypothetical protein